jgi:hypothetical protein
LASKLQIEPLLSLQVLPPTWHPGWLARVLGASEAGRRELAEPASIHIGQRAIYHADNLGPDGRLIAGQIPSRGGIDEGYALHPGAEHGIPDLRPARRLAPWSWKPGRISVMTSADWASWVTAAGTCAIGVGGLGAFVYAARTFKAQSEQLALARQDSVRMRTPVLRGELGMRHPGSVLFLLRLRLISPEPIARLRVTIANPADCLIGFSTGQTGVETWPDDGSLPPGWKNDTTRHEATRDELLLPGAHGQWILEYRKAEYEHGEGSSELLLRAEGTLASGEIWSTPVTVEIAADAQKRLSITS